MGYDEGGKPRYCALRTSSADSHFQQDVENSDKTYGFTVEGHSNRVYEFEARHYCVDVQETLERFGKDKAVGDAQSVCT